MNDRSCYAHSSQSPARWEPLEVHLECVSKLASEFAAAFGARTRGELAGRRHDLGKYSDAFREYLLKSADPDAGEEASPAAGRVDHSTFGAQHGTKAARCFAGRNQP